MLQYLVVCKSFEFDAAHHLPGYEGKCKNHHGHRWKLEVEIEGLVDPSTNMILDFKVVKEIVGSLVVDVLDHTDINILIPYPTAERMIEWIYDQLKESFSYPLKLSRLRLYETPDSFCELFGTWTGIPIC